MSDALEITPPSAAPAPLVRPKFAQFLFDRGLSYRQAGAALNRSRQWVALICLPFDDPRRRIPDRDDMELIVAWTDRGIVPSDFYAPELSAAPDGQVTS